VRAPAGEELALLAVHHAYLSNSKTCPWNTTAAGISQILLHIAACS